MTLPIRVLIEARTKLWTYLHSSERLAAHTETRIRRDTEAMMAAQIAMMDALIDLKEGRAIDG